MVRDHSVLGDFGQASHIHRRYFDGSLNGASGVSRSGDIDGERVGLGGCESDARRSDAEKKTGCSHKIMPSGSGPEKLGLPENRYAYGCDVESTTTGSPKTEITDLEVRQAYQGRNGLALGY
jgi:hypothetical protein